MNGDSKGRDSVNHPTFYASMLGDVRQTAKECGYAIGIHGSMARDCDLIAVPWVEEAKSDEELVEAICAVTKTMRHADDDPNCGLTLKPHGRKCWRLYFGGAPYIDLSIMPKLSK